MINRRDFLTGLSVLPFTGSLAHGLADSFLNDDRSVFSKHLKPIGRILESPDWYVWCSSPIYGPDGMVHLFYSRWSADKKMEGWINGSEIAHAVAKSPESPFEYVDTILAPRAGAWDATTCHNPHIVYTDGRYCLFYMGNSNGKTDTQRIGMATAKSLKGPWKRMDKPLLQPGAAGAWDDHCTTNPSFVKHPNGQYWLYYKSWNTQEEEKSTGADVRGNRKYGLAVATRLTGPYRRVSTRAILDFSGRGNNAQFEDAYVWLQHGEFNMLARDMGVFGNNDGLYLNSTDGIRWEAPKIAYGPIQDYTKEPEAPKHLSRYGRLERPQLLMRHGRPRYLFAAAQGGKHMTSSPFIFRITGGDKEDKKGKEDKEA
ncbi:hypothetical protein GCM10027592_05670 [Spirosoma flavus]